MRSRAGLALIIVVVVLGLLASLAAFLYALGIIYRTLVFGDAVRGYPSLMVVILFFGGVQLMALGVIGEYLGRMFNETKGRPLYFIKGLHPATPRRGEEGLSAREPSSRVSPPV